MTVLTTIGTQNIPSSGRELFVGSYTVTGGTVYVAVIRGPDGEINGVAETFVATYTAGASTGVDSITTISTVGAGTLTAAALAGGIITRSGSTGAYTDTTDTAANLLLQLPTFVQNSAKTVHIRNTVNYAETIVGGTNVTIAGSAVVPANSVGYFLLVRTDANTATPTFTMTGFDMVPLTVTPYAAATALSTVGAGTITAAGIAGQVTTRSGTQTAVFTDTTDTAVNIVAALPDAVIGQSFLYTYVNNTLWQATLAGGSGVTASGSLVVPAGCSLEALVTVTSLTAVSFQSLGVFSNEALPNAQNTAVTGGSATAAAGVLSGALFTAVTYSTQAAITVTTRTGTQMAGDIPNIAIGQSYTLRIANTNTGLLTLSGGTGVTPSIITSVPASCWAEWVVTYTAANTFTMVGVAMGQLPTLPTVQYAADTTGTTETFAAGVFTGAMVNNLRLSGGSAYTATTRTATQMFGDIPNAVIGMSFVTRVVNANSGTVTIGLGTNVTCGDTLTIATNTWREFQCTFTSATAMTMHVMGTGTYS